MNMKITRIALATLAAASIGLVACGGAAAGSSRDAQGVRDAYKQFTHLYLNGDADKACNTYMTARARMLVKTLGGSCKELFSEIARSDAPSDAQIDKMPVAITDDKATYKLPNDDGTAVYASGHWRFDADPADTKDDSAAAPGAANASTDSDGDGISDDADSDPYAANDADQAPTEDEDTAPTEDASVPKQTFHGLNEWGQDDGMRVKVTSVEKVQSIPPADEFSDGVVDKSGSSLIGIKLTIQNAGSKAIDPLCGGANGFVLLDENDRNFDALNKTLDINDNVCDDGIQPGFKSSYTLAYRLPSGSQIGGLVVWNSDAEDDFDGQKTELVFTP
jgi:hypothetical protein